MVTFLVILLLIYLFFYFLPRFLPHILRWLIKRQVRRTMRAAGFGGASSPFGNPSGQKPGEPKRRAKKIDPGVGEYIHFEEIEVSSEQKTDAAGRRETKFKVEEQVVDVEWEDI